MAIVLSTLVTGGFTHQIYSAAHVGKRERSPMLRDFLVSILHPSHVKVITKYYMIYSDVFYPLKY